MRLAWLPTVTAAISATAGSRSLLRATRTAVPCAHAVSPSSSSDQAGASVSGVIYEAPAATMNAPKIQLFTKAGCTLCDKAKDVLVSVSSEWPHTLEAIDITDADKQEWWERYKYDIPVLHLEGIYWAKHRIDADQARAALAEASAGEFLVPSRGEPDARRARAR